MRISQQFHHSRNSGPTLLADVGITAIPELWGRNTPLQWRVPLASRRIAVLIVEDDAHLRLLYRAALTAAGYAVVAVEDGVDALRHIEHGSVPDIVLLDLDLPRLAGRDLHRELQAHSTTRGIPVVVITGTDTANFDHATFACVLQKPIDVDDVICAVENCLRKARRGNNS